MITIPVSGGKGDGGGGNCPFGGVATTETEADVGGGLTQEADAKVGVTSGFAGMATDGLN